MKTQCNYTLITTSIILLIGLLIFINSNSQLRNSLKDNNLKLVEKEIKLSSVLWTINQHFKYTGKKFTDFHITINKQKQPFSIILNDKYDFFYKFSLEDCSSCITSELKNIKEKAKYTKILIETSSSRDFKTFIDINHIDTTKVFQIEKPILEDAEQPFYFVTNKETYLRDIFFPVKEMSEFTLKYFQAMRDKYFNNYLTF